MIISVIGSHSISVQPDRAVVHFTVSSQEVDSDPAPAVRARAASLADELHDLVTSGQALRHTVDALRTSSWRQTDPQGQTTGTAREASVRLSITFADFAELESLTNRDWDELVNLEHISWQLSDELRRSKRDEVIAAAIADAKARARSMADACGLGGLELVQLGDVEASGEAQLRGAFAMKSAGQTISPDDLQISEQVMARFEGGPRRPVPMPL